MVRPACQDCVPGFIQLVDEVYQGTRRRKQLECQEMALLPAGFERHLQLTKSHLG